jgi:hypothetical protein
MRNLPVVAKLALLLNMLSLFTAHLAAQPKPNTSSDEGLFRTIAGLDSAVFEAYNRCDLQKFGAFFADDLEFYHDKGGLMRSRQSLVEAVRKNICGKVRRELVSGTLEVYPMDGFGAVEMGVHRFYDAKSAQREPTGEAKFIHLWQNTNGEWKITRVISYDHQPLLKEIK